MPKYRNNKKAVTHMFKLSKNNISIILTIITAIFIIVTAVLAMLYFIPAKSVVTNIQLVNVQKSQPVKITSFDIDLSYEGNQDDFENLLDNQSDPADEDFSIDNVTFNEDNQNIDVPHDYFNDDDENQALNNLLHTPYYVGQNYYSNNNHPAVKVTTHNTNLLGQRLKSQTKQHNIWPKDLHVGQRIHQNTFTTDNHTKLNNYENTSYFTQPTNQQNTILHVEGHCKLGKYNHSWTGDYHINVNPQNHKLTWKQSDITNN